MKRIENIMAKRIIADDWMCERINGVLDNLEKCKNFPYAIGQIIAIMENAKRRKEGEYGILDITDLTDDDNCYLRNYLAKTKM